MDVPALAPDPSQPGRLTALTAVQAGWAAQLPPEPLAAFRAAQGLVVEPSAAVAAGVSAGRQAEKDLRPASALVEVLLRLSPAPPGEARPPQLRLVGTCRHDALLACTLLRLRGVPARCRCGFATYFQPGKGLDHWITEYRCPDRGRWVRVDTELLGSTVVERPEDLAAGEFLTGGEAWSRYRAGLLDPDVFGVAGTDHAWGVAEIRGNAVRDLAALMGVEMLPWDEWGRLTDSYAGRTGADYDRLVDRVAVACASDDPALIARTYALEDLAVPSHLVG